MARDGGSRAFPGVQRALTVLGLVLGWQGMGALGPSRGSESSYSVRPGTGMARDGGSLTFPGFRELSQC